MDPRRTGVGGAIGLLTFLACFGALTAERFGVYRLTASTESATVWAGAAVTVLLGAGFAYRVGSPLGTWLVAFGPSLAFTLNLFLPVSVDVPSALIFGLASGGAVATALALFGYVFGRGARTLGGDRGSTPGS